jgi:hypothetical protein
VSARKIKPEANRALFHLLLPRSSVIHSLACSFAVLLASLNPPSRADDVPGDRKSLVVENPAARLVIDLEGGSIGEFRFQGADLNPLSWDHPKPGDLSLHGFGHFLCLDRWGAPSKAEVAQGMPYHGEAAHVLWQVVREAEVRDGAIEAQVSAILPKAGLSVRRTIRLSAKAPVCAVREEVRNDNPLGRIYNMVQHPTIAPPFLNETTLVDCNGRKGFAQGGTLPNPEEPSFFWPQGLNADGERLSMRRLINAAAPGVASYTIEASYGWVTAATPATGLLIGYLWKARDYPWVSLWRDVREGRPAARGLEFGTTGLHQTFDILVQKGRIWDRPLFEYLDSGATAVRSYVVFLVHIPADFAGVDSITLDGTGLVLTERAETKPRAFRIETESEDHVLWRSD